MKKIKNIILVLGLSFLSFSFVGDYFEISKNIEIFNAVYREINMFYVEEVKPGKLMKKAINSMLKSLDPYTTYIPESEIEDFKFQRTGVYGGIGAIISKVEDYVIIREPYYGFPAQKTGLMAGDKFLKINNEDVKGKSVEYISSKLKGEVGTKVNVVVSRENKEHSFSLKREKIKVDNVPYYGVLSNDIGYIVLSNFRENAAKDIQEAYSELNKKYAIKKLILDLRNNPGGLLNESVDIVNIFVPKSTEIVSTKSRHNEYIYKAKHKALDTEIPLVVLVNGGSASASEIVSGSLQDLDRAVIIGEKTYGKGLVQGTKPLPYNSQLKYTTAKYYLPSGRCIQEVNYSGVLKADSLSENYTTLLGRKVSAGNGIHPDITVLNNKDVSSFLVSVIRNNYIFDFATEYRLKNKDFSLVKLDTNKIFKLFEDFISQKEHIYETNSEAYLDTLVSTIKNEKYDNNEVVEIFEKIEDIIKNEKSKDLYNNKNVILDLIIPEISSRFFYQKGRIEANLLNDKQIQKAKFILSDINEYNMIFEKIN